MKTYRRFINYTPAPSIIELEKGKWYDLQDVINCLAKSEHKPQVINLAHRETNDMVDRLEDFPAPGGVV